MTTNANNTNINVVRGDKLYNINFTVKQASLSDPSETLPINLSGASIKFKVAPINNISSLSTNGTCTVLVAADGTCYYTVQNSDFVTVGQYRGELEVTYVSTGQVITAPKIYINCISDLG